MSAAKALAVALPLLALALPAQAEVEKRRVETGGYFRVMTRPDSEGGDSRLGYSNLYGRLLNEGPWAAVETRLSLLPEQDPVTPWTSVHAKVEGGAIANTDPRGGGLENFSLTQLYLRVGNVGLRNVTWQVGTLDTYLGELSLYDMKPAQVFYETVGISGRLRTQRLDIVLGAGDSGYAMRGADYDTIYTAGGLARVRLSNHFELGGGGQYLYEPRVPGNRFAPYRTPGVSYGDYARGEVAQAWLEEHPGREDEFTAPVADDARSWKAVGYVGFGKLGPLLWNNFYVNHLRRHPERSRVETFDGRDYEIFLTGLTDERYQINVGNEAHVSVVPGRLDAIWGVAYGRWWDLDNEIAPSDDARTFASTVLRMQLYLSERVHLLGETSAARELSSNGNLYRDHVDSIFQGTGGVSDENGLEYGDSDRRATWQGKVGLVLNPMGAGIFNRPSLRILYGMQHSTQNNAFGNRFVETLDDQNRFGNEERHWHRVLAVEAEAWF